MNTSPLLLEGRRAIVTGAASGIGCATARLFAQHGAQVLAVDRDTASLSRELGGQARISLMVQDVAAKDAGQRIAMQADENLGSIDVLVNNAGALLAGSIEEISDDAFMGLMETNVASIFRITKACLPALKKSGRGRIINMGSITSMLSGPQMCAYGTSKHAVAGLTKSLAVDLAPYGITANFIQPGAIMTGMTQAAFEDAAYRDFWERKAPAGRLGVPLDIARACLFLASDLADFVSGHGLSVDGAAVINM